MPSIPDTNLVTTETIEKVDITGASMFVQLVAYRDETSRAEICQNEQSYIKAFEAFRAMLPKQTVTVKSKAQTGVE